MRTADIAGVAWRDYGEVILCADEDEMLAEADRIAAEHVEVLTSEPRLYLERRPARPPLQEEKRGRVAQTAITCAGEPQPGGRRMRIDTNFYGIKLRARQFISKLPSSGDSE